MFFANVIVDISLEKLDRPFGYIIPKELEEIIHPGSVVEVPFGKGNRKIKGFVIEVTDKSDYPVERMKEIFDVSKSSESVTSRLIELSAWMKENYGSTMNQALKTVLPVKTKVRAVEKKTIVLILDRTKIEETCKKYAKKNAKAKLRLLEELKEAGELSRDIVIHKLNISTSTLKAMESEGVIGIKTSTRYRNPVVVEKQPEYDIVLNEEQKSVADSIEKSMDKIDRGEKDYRVHLIHGITGSGKTEVYMDLIAHCLHRKKEAIVLIPEIALTYQTVKRFTRRFGNQVSIINSRLSKGERFDQFERAKNGDVRIMIGPRSALFTPFKNLGLIIMDEEHEGSYKSESVPKYQTREVAEKLAEMTNATLVLGSATPSLEAYYRTRQGIYRLHRLTSRGKGKPADVSVVDLREELKNGNKSIFSIKLQEMIADRLAKKQQTMLFINRRGYAGFVSCRECGVVMKCPHCDVSLKAHNNGMLVCHYCGYETAIPRLCPKCGSKYIAGFGTGTQKVETMIKQLFPSARVLRMDMDTTSKKGGHEEILQAFANQDADILVGTQMIVKGHDFPNVTLVGVLAADLSLYASDYRASERTFELLTQAAGRAGRGEVSGDVIIQTYNPEDYSIQYSKEQDYESFYREEISYRRLMQYPPVAEMTAILATCPDRDLLEEAMKMLVSRLQEIQNTKEGTFLIIIGPADASVAKINDVYRKVIYLKHRDKNKLIAVKNELEKLIYSSQIFHKVNVQFDFTPSGNY